MRSARYVSCAVAVMLLCLPLFSQAQAPVEEREFNAIQGGHSGTWYHPGQPGHGLFVEVLNDASSPTGKEVVVAWFAYLSDHPVWLLGQGDVLQENGGFVAVLAVSIYQGNDFPPRFDPASVERTPWGVIVISFTGCDKAHINWDSDLEGYGAGELSLRRLSQVADSSCIPNLGGYELVDDHGDDWADGSYLNDIGREQRKLNAYLNHKGDVDVFVFTTDISVEFKAFTFGVDDVKTKASLYRVVDDEEVLIASADDDDPMSGFVLEEYLFPGTYAVHVMGKEKDLIGPYTFYYQAFWD